MSTFSFRLRFILAPYDAIGLTEASVALAPAGAGVAFRLKAHQRDNAIKDARDLVVTGESWDSEQDAREVGMRVKNSMMLALSTLRTGADFGDRRRGSFFYPAGLKMLERQTGERVLNDVHGLMTFTSHPPPRFAPMSASIERTIQPDRFLAAFERAYQTEYTPTEAESLAFELYNASFFERTPRTRFLTLVIAVEALLQPKERGPKAMAHVRYLIEQTQDSDALTDTEKASLTGSLSWLLHESISQTGRNLAAERLGERTYMELPAPAFFSHCYELRGDIVHPSGVKRDERIIDSTAATLQTFVADLLAGFRIGLDT